MSNVTGQTTLVNDAIGIALERVYQYHDWPYYMMEQAIKTTALYDTGTAAVTQDSASVIVTTGVLTATMVGRKFRVENEKPYYRISAVNTGTNTLTLEQPYQGDDNATATYEIFKDEFRLASDVDKYKTLRQIQNGIPMWTMSPTRFDERFPTPQSYADPLFNMMVGTKLDTYSTGTISASGTTITGAGTSWTSVEGLGRMSLITIGTSVYTVKSLDSATQLTTYESAGTVAALTTYKITMNNLVVQMYQIPDAQRLIYYRYFRLPEVLANDQDIPDMPHDFHHLLVWGALSMIYMQKGDAERQQECEQRFTSGIMDMKMKLGSFTPDKISVRKSTDSTSRRKRFDGIENSNFDRRYSM